MMTTILLASKLIRVVEGCQLTSYWDPTGKVWTIGFGHTRDVTRGMTITMEQAVAFLAEDCAPLLPLVADKPMIEAAMLVSFGYNCGIGALKRVLAGEIKVENEEFIVKPSNLPYGQTSGGKPLAGLVARRGLEAAFIEASRAAIA